MPELNITYPAGIDTDADKFVYLTGLDKLNLRIYDAMGRLYRGELTRAQFDKLPAKIKTEYPFDEGLTKEQLGEYEVTFKFGYRKVLSKIHFLRNALFESFENDNPKGADFERDIA